jgi:signal transduction histidine kinase
MKEQVAAKKPEIKILVVDDREDNLMSIETILEKDGYTIKKANSGRAALKILLKEHDFTLILMDVQMPDLTGFETATLIYERDKLKHVPIIFITANDFGEESIFKSYQMGGVDYINKPINPELLRAKVSVFVDLYIKTHQLMVQEQKLMAINKNLEKEVEERTISQQKIQSLNTQLLDNILQLKATNEELERFAYVASHDLQEPLRKIIIFGDRLTAKYGTVLGEDGVDYIGRMKKASERMQSLIKNILSFSKSVANAGPFEETNLNNLINEVLSDLQLYIEQKNAVFNIDKLPELKIIPTQFRQLIQNLIINALKFSKDDVSPVIAISAEKIKGMTIPGISTEMYDEPYWKISITDNGIGFDEKYAEQIFMIFKRLHSFDQFEGTGIGLSICKKIVEKHNGFINATSRPGHGATFNIIIPQKQPDLTNGETPAKKKLLA